MPISLGISYTVSDPGSILSMTRSSFDNCLYFLSILKAVLALDPEVWSISYIMQIRPETVLEPIFSMMRPGFKNFQYLMFCTSS
jgi:hypothetical protein